MKILIIYAHPNKKSFNHAALEHIQNGLDWSGNHSYQVIDLYEEQFNPILKFDEEDRRHDLHKDPEMKKYRDLVKESDILIFIFPIWWHGLPAILKGFFDRVFVKNFAYSYEEKFPKGLLTGKSAWVLYTQDSSKWFVALFRMNSEWLTIKWAILKFCGFKRVRKLMFTGVKDSSLEKRESWLSYLEKEAQKL